MEKKVYSQPTTRVESVDVYRDFCQQSWEEYEEEPMPDMYGPPSDYSEEEPAFTAQSFY
jgi:hypothetical protein